jgi:peroxiredoxin
MEAWAKDQGIEGSFISFLADPTSSMSKALGMVLEENLPDKLGYARCKRFACVVVDGVIKALNVSEGPGDPAGDATPESPVMTCVEQMIKEIETLK